MPASGDDDAPARLVDLGSVEPPPKSPVSAAFLDAARTLPSALATLAERFPEFECLTLLGAGGRERRTSLGRLWRRSVDVSAALAAQGVRPGDFVVLILPTGPELVSAYFGVMAAGAVPALLATPSNRIADHSVYTTRLRAILDNCRPRVLYCIESVAKLLGETPGLTEPACVLTPAAVPSGASGPPGLGMDPEDTATIQYSSGSTGAPKGVLLSHRAILNNLRAVRDAFAVGVSDVSVNWIPLYHDMGLIDAFLLPLLTGCPLVLIPTLDFMHDPVLWLRAIHHYRGTLSFSPNFGFAVCAKRVPPEQLAGLDLSSWRAAVSAAEPVLAHTVDAFIERLAPHGLRPEVVTPGWGLAENVTFATAQPVGSRPLVETLDRRGLVLSQEAHPANDGVRCVSVGPCLRGCEVDIRREGGERVAPRVVGTIWLRSDCLFSGYYRAPDETRRVLVDGWLDTGDQGYLDEHGNLYFTARAKDLIVVGGEKYAPQEIEEIISRVPGVRDGCAVAFGVLDEERGTEDLAAVVETRETHDLTLSQLRETIQVAVARAIGLGLRHVILVPPGGVEKTTSGKLARRATRARYADRLR